MSVSSSHHQASVSVWVETYQFHVSCASLLVCFGYNCVNDFIVEDYGEHEVYWQTGSQHVNPIATFVLALLYKSHFTRLPWQNVDDDGQESSSEGSTVDDMPGEGGESADFELEESMDPDACFPLGEYLLQSLTPLSLLWRPQS